VIAKNLGIKPGSEEFHALKKGDFKGDDADVGKGKGKEKGKIERMIEVTKLFPSLVFDEIVFEDTNFGL